MDLTVSDSPVSGADRGQPQARLREDVVATLRAHGISPTHQRIEIGCALFEKRQHQSADQILSRVNQRNAEASKATVYNTLNLFVEKGLVRELVVDPAKVFYDPNTSVHHHFYDVATGELTDIAPEGVKIEGLPPPPAGTVAEGIDIIVRTRPARSPQSGS
jgi:Fur family iron response transcriptional regulator